MERLISSQPRVIFNQASRYKPMREIVKHMTHTDTCIWILLIHVYFNLDADFHSIWLYPFVVHFVVTEEEVLKGLLIDPDPDDHCLCFIRELTDINLNHSKAWRFIDQSDNGEVRDHLQFLVFIKSN